VVDPLRRWAGAGPAAWGTGSAEAAVGRSEIF
jgi:hypothetical protein